MFSGNAVLLVSCLCMIAGGYGVQNETPAVQTDDFPIGPTGGSTSSISSSKPTESPVPPTQNTTAAPSSTPKPTTTAPTSKPTTTSTSKPTTASTSKPTTTTSTPKPTTTTSTPKPTTTTSTPKPTTLTPNTTTAVPTTPKPSPAPVDPVGTWMTNYTNTNRTCLVLQAAIEIDLPYQEGNTSKMFTVKVPPTATANGTCETDVENLNVLFGLSGISFRFKKNNDTKKYDLESIVVNLNVTIPGVNGTLFSLVHNKSEFSTPLRNSYKCAKEQTLNLTSNPTPGNYSGLLRISHFQVQPFRNDTNTKFDAALDCQGYETPDVVPIAVGCALAALVIIVLIAYLIGRRRSQARGYLSM